MTEEKILSNVVSIQMYVSFDGYGCVNCDSTEQKEILFHKGFLKNGVKNDNFQFSKKVFTRDIDADGNVCEGFNHKVSSDCLKHGAFGEDEVSPNLLLIDKPYYTSLSTMCGLVRGCANIMRSEKPNCRTSGLNLIDAIECIRDGNQYKKIPHNTLELEISTPCNNGYILDENNNVVDGKKTIIKKENIGETSYRSRLTIIMKDLMFINCGYRSNHLNVDTENKLFDEIYVPNVSKINGSNIKDTLGFYYLKTSQAGKYNPRYGMVISKSGINKLVMYILSSIARLEIYRSRGAYLKFAKFLDVVVNMSDGTSCNLGDMTFEEISQYVFERDDMYVKVDEEDTNEISSVHKPNCRKKTKSKKNADSNED